MIFLIDSMSKNLFWVFLDDRDKISVYETAIADDAGAGGYSTHLPRLPNRVIGNGQALVGLQLMTSPHDSMEIRVKQEGVEAHTLNDK